ncbi:MAG: hypothetical protein ACTTKH_01710 [Treponema sp.]
MAYILLVFAVISLLVSVFSLGVFIIVSIPMAMIVAILSLKQMKKNEMQKRLLKYAFAISLISMLLGFILNLIFITLHLH